LRGGHEIARSAAVITITLLRSDGTLQAGGAELLAEAGPKWIDVQGPTEEEMGVLGPRLGLHRLAIEDTLHLDQRPKLEEYPCHLFVVLHGFAASATDVCELTLHEMHCFLGPDWLLTAHDLTNDAIQATRKRIEADPGQTMGRGMDFVLYLVADAMVDRNFPILDGFGDEVEELEVKIFKHARPRQLQRIFDLKRALVTLRRVLSPQRDVVGLLSRRGVPHVQERTTLYFRDVYDHLIRVYEQIEASRDVLGSATDAYLSMMANRTNDITKQLTIFASIFLPLSFIAGFFGQNFEVLSARPFLYTMLGLMVTVPVVMVWWFNRKGWIEERRPR
jgi:magnesium transporter